MWRFYLYTNKTNPVQRPEESITSLKGISENYQFVVRNEGVLYNRRRVCYCLPCIAAMQDSFIEWNGETHVIPDCCMSALGTENNLNVYAFDRSRCKRTHGPNVTQQLQLDKGNRKEMATALNIGDWVLFDSKMEDEPI